IDSKHKNNKTTGGDFVTYTKKKIQPSNIKIIINNYRKITKQKSTKKLPHLTKTDSNKNPKLPPTKPKTT
ncbi:hypothetical protein Q4498_18270, partial [Neptunomonas phycophila]|uniref:hypothetical protein n=1 Tax=Neptunomonas phycophila TaxID=1572645 RepID=UPI0026E1E242